MDVGWVYLITPGLTSPSIAAIARGFSLIEVHATFDKRMFGPDVKASLTIDDIEQVVQFASNLKLMDDNPVVKDDMAKSLNKQKNSSIKSLALVKDLLPGMCYQKMISHLKNLEVDCHGRTGLN